MTDKSVDSPCTGVCVLDPSTSLCQGCRRNVAEITGWSVFTNDQKRAVLEQLAERNLPPKNHKDNHKDDN